MHTLLTSLIIVLGLGGFLIAQYIYRKKKAKTKLVCPRRSNCDTVIHSDYSKIFGIPVEGLGMYYYASVVITYCVFLFRPANEIINLVVLGISMSSVLFSIYLVSMQAFVIKQWCAWCLASASISLLILILSYTRFTL